MRVGRAVQVRDMGFYVQNRRPRVDIQPGNRQDIALAFQQPHGGHADGIGAGGASPGEDAHHRDVVAAPHAQVKVAPAAGDPVLVLETAKGTIEIELFVADAPKSTAHVMALVRRGFYRGLRFHRVVPSLVQIGDPATRNVAAEASWGSGSSGTPIGVAELSTKHPHVRGTVGLGYSGTGPDAAKFADSQFYIMRVPSPSLTGKYTVIGRVISGMDVVDKIERKDVVKNTSIRAAAGK